MSLLSITTAAALLGSVLIAGVFFAFSNFVMKALAAMPSSQGIAAMQSINIVVINPGFLGVFLGTAALSMGVVWLALSGESNPATSLFLGASASYFVGTFLVTMFFNIPLNNQLEHVSSMDDDKDIFWEHYLNRWTTWNHVRTLAAFAAALIYIAALFSQVTAP